MILITIMIYMICYMELYSNYNDTSDIQRINDTDSDNDMQVNLFASLFFKIIIL